MADTKRATIGLIATVALIYTSVSKAETLHVGETLLRQIGVESLAGWDSDDFEAALAAFRLGCKAETPPPGQLPSVMGSTTDIVATCSLARQKNASNAKAFFQNHFVAYRVQPSPTRKGGLLTGYFEPVLEGSLTPSPAFTAPILSRPDDLVSLAPGETLPGLDPVFKAARRTGDHYEPYPDRAAIEDGTIAQHTRPLLWLPDAVDVLVLQIQGSARVRLRDGHEVRVLYDGKNGRAFTGVPRLIVEGGHLPLEGLTLERWTTWLRQNPEEGRRLMRQNASYVFFRVETVTDATSGPIGASGAALTAGRSIAVDGSLWRYGLPVWLEGRLPGKGASDGRLVIAQDTGTAITGPARADLYVGSGPEAGRIAGNIRNEVGFVVLLPKVSSSSDARNR